MTTAAAARIATPVDLAHDAVYRKTQGEQITPATITAALIADGATPAQAASTTKITVALIPTVTTASLRKWLATRTA